MKSSKRNTLPVAAASRSGGGAAATQQQPPVPPLAASMVTFNDGVLVNPETDTSTTPVFRDRCQLFHVECDEFVVWRTWAPGGEYRLVWRIKNLSDVAQVIQYKQPLHKAVFFIQFPEPVTLATGTYFDLVINFRPNALATLRDSIEVSIGRKGVLKIQLVAVTPYQQLGVPDKVDFGLCATGVVTSRPLQIKNIGTADIVCDWEVAAPFRLTPNGAPFNATRRQHQRGGQNGNDQQQQANGDGGGGGDTSGDDFNFNNNNNNNNNDNNNNTYNNTNRNQTQHHGGDDDDEVMMQLMDEAASQFVLRPGMSLNMTISVEPTSAQALVTRLVCRDAHTRNCVGHFNASAVAKYPFVMCQGGNEAAIDFGSVFTGQSLTKAIMLDNVGMVPAHFTVVRADSDVVNPFSFLPAHGTVPPGGKIGFQVKFHPESPGATYRNVYHVRVQGGNTVVVTCSGTATGANLSLSATHVDFGDVAVFTNKSHILSQTVEAQPVKKVVTLRNTGNVPAEWRIAQCGVGNVFRFDKTTGVVPANSSRSVTISFLPPAPNNYLRRAYFLVKHGEASLAIDMLGTGFSSKLRPAPFTIQQVREFFSRVDGGLGRCAPEELALLCEKLRDPAMRNLEDESEVAALAALEHAKLLSQQHQNFAGSETATAAGGGATSGGGAATVRSATSTRGGGGGGGKSSLRASLGGSQSKRSTSVIAPRMIVAAGRKIDATRGHSSLDELPMLLDPSESAPLPFTMDEHQLVFRQPGGQHVEEQQIVTVFNHTASKATAVWVSMLAGVGDDGVSREVTGASGPGASGADATADVLPYVPWTVTPAVADIPAHGSTQFFVSCNRDVADVTGTFNHYLECFVGFKQMRTFRLVSEDTFSPPTCLVLEAQRLVPMPETAATPEAEMPATVAFPAQLLNHSTYQVISIANLNETVMSFNISIEDLSRRFFQQLQQNPGGGAAAAGGGGGGGGGGGDFMPGAEQIAAAVAAAATNPAGDTTIPGTIDEWAAAEAMLRSDNAFTCYPQSGSIAPRESVLIAFRFRPTQRKRYRATAVVSVNDVSFGSRHISLRGEGFVPQLLLADHGVLSFRPTAVGARTVREYRVHNPSRVNVEFFFDVPPKFADVYRIEPPGGVLGPNEHVNLTATFAPGNTQRYETRIPISVRSPQVHETEENVVHCTVVGEGCANVLQVEPINLSLGEVLAGSDHVSEFTIFNVGICDVYFEVRALMIDAPAALVANTHRKNQTSIHVDGNTAFFSPQLNNNNNNNNENTGGGGGGGNVPSAFDPQQLQQQQQQQQQQQNNGGGLAEFDELSVASPTSLSGNQNPHLNQQQQSAFALHHVAVPEDAATAQLPHVQLNPSSGFLRARSHVRILVKTRVIKAGPANFAICVVHHGSQQIVKEAEPSLSDLVRLPHVNMQVRGRHPLVEFCDVCCSSQRKSRLWQQMSFDAVNAQLSRPVEACDCEKDSFDFAGAIHGLEPNVCDLGVDVIRTAPIRVLTCLKNQSPFPVSFAFWFADQQVGTDDLAQLEDADTNSASLVQDRHLFAIEPRSGTIAPGETATVVFSYKHCYVGSHATPVILQVDDGKRILLHLAARTLGESERFLSFHFSREHRFAPVAIGDIEPPLQYVELQNVGYESVNYTVDQEALIEQRDRNGDFPIMQCLNPQGTVPPLSTLLLCWCFRPLEAKRYETTIQIHVEDGDSYPLKLIGDGYHPAQLPLSQVRDLMASSFAPIPAAAQLKHELAPIQLSWDVLNFSVIPMHSLHRRVLVLTNTHPRDTFLFEWNTVMQFGDHIVEIDPPRGRIRPGERVTSRVSLYAGSTAQLINLGVSCHVLNEDLRNRRIAARQLRSHRAAESLDVVVADDSAQAKDAAGYDEATVAAKRERNRQRAAQRTSLASIPPAFQSAKQLRAKIRELTDAAAAEELSEDDPRLVFVDVVPGVVEVLLQAYVLEPDAFASIFGSAPVSFFPTLAAYATPVPDEQRAELLGSATPEELALAQDVVAGLLQQVVHHRRVRDATADISEDPVPYFYEVATLPAVEEYRSKHSKKNEATGGTAAAGGGATAAAATVAPAAGGGAAAASSSSESIPSSTNAAPPPNHGSTATLEPASAQTIASSASASGEHNQQQERDFQLAIEQQAVASLMAAQAEAADGYLRCLAEEIAEQLVFDMLQNPHSAESVVMKNRNASFSNVE